MTVEAQSTGKVEVQEPTDAKAVLESILDLVPTGITVAFGRQAVIHSVSSYGLRLIAREEREVTKIGADRHPDAWQIFDRDGVNIVNAESLPLTRACAGETVHGEELFIMSSTGNLIPIVCNAGPIRGPAGEVVGGIIAWHDIASLHETMTRNAVLAREAQAATAAKSDLLAKVAHELRSPLSAVLGWTRIARSATSPAELAKALDIIERNARLQSRIVEDLLDLHRAQSGALQVDLLDLQLDAIVEGAVDSVRPVAADKAVAIDVVLHALCVKGDQVRLQQIVSNLLVNAVKFSPKGSRVKVELLEQDGRAVLKVTDAGVGMNAQECAHAFEPFWQGDNSGASGLGLGLAICRSLAGAHAGQISVHSDGLGSGCCFTLELPLGVGT